MRIAIVSDIHGNLTAFEAVVADLSRTAPDLIFHGGDLATSGSSPAQIVDRIRALGWQGVVGNTDEMLYAPESLREFANQSPTSLEPLFAAVQEIAAATCEALGTDRLAWLRTLPRLQTHSRFALVHAAPESLWRAPMPEASDAELHALYAPLGQPIAIYGHIHRSYIRRVSVANGAELVVANSGSVGLPHDGDRRAAYLLLDDSNPTVRRVEYDLDAELKLLSASGLPHANWVAKILTTASPQMP